MLTISSAGWSTRWVGQCTPTRPCVEKAWCQVAARDAFVEDVASFQEARLITWWNVTLSQACSILFIVLVCLQLHGCPYPDAVWAPGEAWLDCGCWPRSHKTEWIDYTHPHRCCRNINQLEVLRQVVRDRFWSTLRVWWSVQRWGLHCN